MKFWSEAEYRWIDGDVVYSGRGAMPHELRDREYWQQKDSMLLNAAPDAQAYPSRKEVKKANLVPCDDRWREYQQPAPESPRVRCACGRPLTPTMVKTGIRRCVVCSRKKRNMRKVA